MDSIQDIVTQLKSDNFSSVNNALQFIKKHCVRKFHKMQELERFSVLQTLVSLLEHPKFCNTSLSIIADACLKTVWARKVIQYNGIKSLTRIMKSLINDDIQHRACRAIANIAKHELDFSPFRTNELITNIITFLLETEDISFKITAIRTLRILSKDSRCRYIIIHEKGVCHIVELLKSSDKDLILCCARALAEFTENCSRELASQLMEYFECLINLCKQCDVEVKIYLMKCLKNLAFQPTVRSDLIKLGILRLFADAAADRESLEVAKFAVFGLCNCLDYMHMWPSYGMDSFSGLKIIVGILEDDSFEDIHLNIILTLRTLSLQQGVVDILIQIGLPFVLLDCLKSFIEKHKFIHQEPFVENNSASSSPLKKFKPDTCEKTPLVNGTQDEVIISGCVYSSSNSFNIRNVSRTDYLDFYSSGASTCHSSSSSSNSTPSPNHNPVGPRFFTDSSTYPLCWSPIKQSPIDDIMCDELREFTLLPKKIAPKDKTSIFRPQTSVTNCADSLSNSFSSGDNADSEEEPEIPNLDNIHLKNRHSITNLQPNASTHIDFDLDVDEQDIKMTNISHFHNENLRRKSNSLGSVEKKKSSRKSMDSIILSLLLRLTFRFESNSNSALANSYVFPVLLEYISSIQKPNVNAENVIHLLIRNRYCFEKLIKNGFLTELEEYLKIIHDPKSCSHCSNIWSIRRNLISAMSEVANTDYGIGTVCHVLCTTEKSCKLLAMNAVAKLFYSRSALYKSLIKANGLSFLFQVLSDPSDYSWEKAIFYLCEIYQSLEKLQLRKFKKCCISQTCKWDSINKCFYKDCIHDVSFIVDDGTKISASREKICKNSDYFQALLGGNFKETNENIVKISHISAEILTTLFHFLHGCYEHAQCCPYIIRTPFEVLLELLSESEKYLLFDIKSYVEDRLCHSLSSVTILKVCEKAKVHNSTILYKKALECALSLDASHQDNSLDCLKLLLELDSNCGILNDIKNLMLDMLEK